MKQFIARPVYVSEGPHYCLIFKPVQILPDTGIPEPYMIIAYTGDVNTMLRRHFKKSSWKLAHPYFAEPEDVRGYRDLAIAV